MTARRIAAAALRLAVGAGALAVAAVVVVGTAWVVGSALDPNSHFAQRLVYGTGAVTVAGCVGLVAYIVGSVIIDEWRGRRRACRR